MGNAVMIANNIDPLSSERAVLGWKRVLYAVAAFKIFLFKSNFLSGGGRYFPSGTVPGAGVLVIHDAGPMIMLAAIALIMHVAVGFERALRIA
jgi:hypothetical protein